MKPHHENEKRKRKQELWSDKQESRGRSVSQSVSQSVRRSAACMMLRWAESEWKGECRVGRRWGNAQERSRVV